jgi:hypothetical protein
MCSSHGKSALNSPASCSLMPPMRRKAEARNTPRLGTHHSVASVAMAAARRRAVGWSPAPAPSRRSASRPR